MKCRFLVSLVLFPLLGGLVQAQPKDFFFQHQDRIVFLGDSITEQYQYSTYIELYLTTRFPKANMTFLNAGISGDTANGGANRFQKHVLDEKPTAITINFGMNDGGYGKFNPAGNKVFVDKTTAMVNLAKKANARVALLSPNAVDRRVQERFKLYLETQKEFYAPLKKIAEIGGVNFVDQYAITRTALEKMEGDDPMAKTAKPFGDGFHTSEPGGLLMAHAILTGLNAPRLVSLCNLEINNEKPEFQGCTIKNIKKDKSNISFERLDDSIPIPVQKSWKSVLPYSNDLKDLNWYGLKVKGLEEGKYQLLIDGKPAGEFTNKELENSINVGNISQGPLFDQGQKVFQMIQQKNQLVHKRFRGTVMNGKLDPETKANELKEKMEEIQKKQEQIYQLVQPVSRTWELKKI